MKNMENLFDQAEASRKRAYKIAEEVAYQEIRKRLDVLNKSFRRHKFSFGNGMGSQEVNIEPPLNRFIGEGFIINGLHDNLKNREGYREGSKALDLLDTMVKEIFEINDYANENFENASPQYVDADDEAPEVFYKGNRVTVDVGREALQNPKRFNDTYFNSPAVQTMIAYARTLEAKKKA